MPTAPAPPARLDPESLPTQASGQQLPPAQLERLRRSLPTPVLLRTLSALTIAAIALCTLSAMWSLLAARAPLDRAWEATATASAATTDLARVVALRTELSGVHARAAENYLAADQKAGLKDQSLARARDLLSATGQTGAYPTSRIQEVGQAIDEYDRLLTTARTQHGTPQGYAALIQAGEHLRDRLAPMVDGLVSARSTSATPPPAPAVNPLPQLTGWLAVLLLLLTGAVTAIRFRRVLNVGLAAALCCTVSMFLITTTTLGDASRNVPDIMAPVNAQRALATALGHAYTARSHELAYVIAQKDDAAAQGRWEEAAQKVRSSLQEWKAQNSSNSSSRDDPSGYWSSYERSHQQLTEYGAQGRWDAARGVAADEASTVSSSFDGFEQEIRTLIESTEHENSPDDPNRPASPLVGVAIMSLILGLGAIAAVLIGLRPRLREYQ